MVECEKEIEVYIDGSSLGNPGPSGAGMLILDYNTKQVLASRAVTLGLGTNNQAECLALKYALMELQQLELAHASVRVFTDSALVVGLFQKCWRAKANLALVGEVRSLIKWFPKLILAHMPGHNGNPHNEEADRLARCAALRCKNSDGPF